MRWSVLVGGDGFWGDSILDFLTLVGCSGAVPEEGPLQGLTALKLVFEAEGVVLVGELEEICHVLLDYSQEYTCIGCLSTHKAVQPMSHGL